MDLRVVAFILSTAVFTNILEATIQASIDEPCSDNSDCVSQCCLLQETRHRRPVGVCRPFKYFGEYCAPGNRLRDYHTSVVYTYSCPCSKGLSCIPLSSRAIYGMYVVEEPRCLLHKMNPVLMHAQGHGFDPEGRIVNAFPDVPVE